MEQEAKLFPSEILQACACVFAKARRDKVSPDQHGDVSSQGKNNSHYAALRPRRRGEKTTQTGVFTRLSKGTLGKYLKGRGGGGRRRKKATDGRTENKKPAFLSELARAKPHMHGAGKSGLKKEAVGGADREVHLATEGGGAQTIRLVKQRLRNLQNVWNSSSVSSLLALVPPARNQTAGRPGAFVWRSKVQRPHLRQAQLSTRFCFPATHPSSYSSSRHPQFCGKSGSFVKTKLKFNPKTMRTNL